MAITLSLYQVTDDPIVMGKNIGSAVSSHTILLKDGCSIDRPTVTFSAQASAIAALNYAHIDVFGRYYWITDRKSLVNGVVELTLESDPIESFANEIKAVPATITRTEDPRKADAYLLDNRYLAKSYKQIVTKDFPNELTDFSFILMTVG